MAHERPLMVVTDEALLDEVLRLAAAVGCELQRAPDVLAARPAWSRAPLVLVDEEALAHELPRRPGLLLVTKGAPPGSVWQRAFDAGIERVVPLPDREADLVGALADIAEGPTIPGGCVIGVVGGRGGAGASSFAAALALTASGDGSGALLIDCDPLGGGLDMVLGAETADGVRWPALGLDGGRISMPALREALPEHQHHGRRLPFLSCDDSGAGPTRAALASVVDAGRRAGTAVVCDLPRHLGPAAEAVLARADLIVMVVPAEVRACASARRVAAHIQGRLPAPADLPFLATDPIPDTGLLLGAGALPTPDPRPVPGLVPAAVKTHRHDSTDPHGDESPRFRRAEPPKSRPTELPRLHRSGSFRGRALATDHNSGAPPARDHDQRRDLGKDAATESAAQGPADDRQPRPQTHDDERDPTQADAPHAGHPDRSDPTQADRVDRRHTAVPESGSQADVGQIDQPSRRYVDNLPSHAYTSRRHGPTRACADRLCLVVRGPAPGGLTPQDVAKAIQIPLLTSMAPDRQLAKALDRGDFFPRPRSPLAIAARLALAAARAEASRAEAAA